MGRAPHVLELRAERFVAFPFRLVLGDRGLSEPAQLLPAPPEFGDASLPTLWGILLSATSLLESFDEFCIERSFGEFPGCLFEKRVECALGTLQRGTCCCALLRELTQALFGTSRFGPQRFRLLGEPFDLDRACSLLGFEFGRLECQPLRFRVRALCFGQELGVFCPELIPSGMQRSQPLSKFSEALGELAALPRSRTLTLPQGRDLLQELLAFRIGRVQASDRIGNLSTLVLEVLQSGMERVLLLVECPSLLVVPSESSSHGSDRLRFPGEGVVQPLDAAHQLHPLVIELH